MLEDAIKSTPTSLPGVEFEDNTCVEYCGATETSQLAPSCSAQQTAALIKIRCA